eukprot:194588-Chlamydomonas_euryale.AAC.1
MGGCVLEFHRAVSRSAARCTSRRWHREADSVSSRQLLPATMERGDSSTDHSDRSGSAAMAQWITTPHTRHYACRFRLRGMLALWYCFCAPHTLIRGRAHI